MCGRYYRKSDKQKIAEAFHVKHVDDFPLPPADYNVAPTTMKPIVRNNRDTVAILMGAKCDASLAQVPGRDRTEPWLDLSR